MQIRQTGQTIPVSKVETDRREEVKNIKPIGSQQIPDSFETGKSQSSDQQSNSSASAEPAKKAGQITGGILIKQMTQARLADAGIKLANPSATENTGTRDLNDIQQRQAEATSPQVNTKGNPRTPGTTTDYGARVPDGAYTGDARSNMEKNKGALEDFFTQNNIDVPSSGNGVDASDFGVGQGVDLGNGFNTGQTGPSDPMEGINDKFAAMDYVKNAGSIGNIVSEMENALSSADGATHHFGKDMIAANGDMNHGYVRNNPDGTKTKITDTGHVNPKNPKEFKTRHTETTDLGFGTYNVRETKNSKDSSINHTEFTRAGDMIAYNQNATWIDADGNTHTKTEDGVARKDGKETIILESNSTETVTDKDGNVISTTTKKVETKNGKTTTTTTTTTPSDDESSDPNKYVDPEVEKVRKQMDEMSKNLGLDGLWNLQRGPKDQGKGPDYGPEPVGTSIEDAGNGSLLSQFGKDGLVGNPNQQNHTGPSNSNFGGLPGETVTDPLEGSNYHGSTRDKEVDVSPHTDMEQNVDDENKNNRTMHANDIKKQQSKINPDLTPKLHN